ncbi:DUF1638 domain-containing protein [Candidatus Sumerlaeota bacterium]|nr:DUF1638 domain-containing protein [Candidatus Sumerlaeota bacterium]
MIEARFHNPAEPMRLKLIACEIFYRELCACVASSPNVVDAQFLTQGLHDLGGEKMVARLRTEIDAVDAKKYSAILLGFALCNNGIVGLSHPSLPLVVPRAHDCIALLMGSREAYDAAMREDPGTYYKTSGWIERDHENLEDVSADSQSPLAALRDFEALVAKYGEENARHIVETLGDGLKNYTRMAFIDLPGLAPLPYGEATKDHAEKCGLSFVRMPGDLGWLRRLTDGPWNDEDFLVVEPGRKIAPSHDERVIQVQ